MSECEEINKAVRLIQAECDKYDYCYGCYFCDKGNNLECTLKGIPFNWKTERVKDE